MPIRNTWRKGQHLVFDDESGFTEYSDEIQEIWDGTLRHRKNFEMRNPQEFVEAGNDPYPVSNPRQEPPLPPAFNVQEPLVGETDLPSVIGPASHLFGRNGIGAMRIEDATEPFIVA